MAIDTSIYSNIRPVELPSPLDSAQRSMNLSSLALQNKALARQSQLQDQEDSNKQAIKTLYAKNLGPNGQLNQQAFLSDLSKVSPAVAMDYQEKFAKTGKDTAESQKSKAEALQKQMSIAMPAIEHLAGLSENERAAQFDPVIKKLQVMGIDTSNFAKDSSGNYLYDPGQFQIAYKTGKSLKDYLENQKTTAEIGKTKADTAKSYSEAKKASNDSGPQNKAMQSVVTILESARGNPAAAQAEKDLYAADKAKSLTRLYGDPNNLDPRMVNLLVSEVSKIAAGGVPTQHELDALNPGTLQGSLASVWSKLSNNPTPANAGAFIKQYQDYSDALSKDAKKVIQDKYGRVIESRRKQLGEDNYGMLKDQYLNRFNSDESQSASNSTSQYSPPPAGKIRVQSPDGRIGLIDASQKGEAIAAGGKVIK